MKTLLKFSVLILLVALLVVGCTEENFENKEPAIPQLKATTPFSKGADVSWARQMYATGFRWRNEAGVVTSLPTLYKTYGISAIILRVWVNPSSDPGNGHCSPAEVAAEAKLYYNAGYRICINPHYGDTWNSVGHQSPPAAWASYNYTQMRAAMVAHVQDVLNRCKALGVTPTWFKNGNESNLGVCGPVGRRSSNPAQMVGLFNACYDAAKAIFPNIIVISHAAQPQGTSAGPFFAAMQTYGGKYDVMGVSSYAHGGNIPGVFNAIKALKSTYAPNKPLIQVEYGGAWDRTQTATDLRTWIANISSLPNSSAGGGVWYWEPDASPGWNGGYNSGATDATGRPSSGILAAFR